MGALCPTKERPRSGGAGSPRARRLADSRRPGWLPGNGPGLFPAGAGRKVIVRAGPCPGSPESYCRRAGRPAEDVSPRCRGAGMLSAATTLQKPRPWLDPVNSSFCDNMASYHIRLYKDADYKMVRFLFAYGLREQIPILRQYIWKLPRTTLFLLSAFLVLFVGYKYFYISAIEAVLCLAGATSSVFALVWFGAYHIFDSFLQEHLKDDMFDIQHYYIQRKGACFWVAESNEEVVGMVAAEPYSDTDGGMKLELKRLCVNKAFRGNGIAKALCQTLINFARQEGYQSVILKTTIAQHASHPLYKNLGFRKIRCFVPAILLYRLLHCQVLMYRYDISAHH